MKSWILIGLAVMGIAVFLAVEVRAPASQAAPASLPAVETATARTVTAIRTTPPARRASAITTPPAIAEERPAEEAVRSGAGPSREQLREAVERAFGADRTVAASRDRGRDLETQIRAVLPAGSTVRSVECRSELCRIETVHPDLAGFQRYVGDAFAALDSKIATGPVMASVLADPVPGQPVIAVAFLGREGTELPSPSPVATGESR